jgi:oxalate decarboxylase/phosphoglucose isomerase-like protein (cupin superfamily)
MTPTDAKHPNERPRHWHPTGELQFFLTGDGLLLDADGNETPISKGGSVFSRPGPGGAHGFRNTGTEPLQILSVYPSAGGAPSELSSVDPVAVAALDLERASRAAGRTMSDRSDRMFKMGPPSRSSCHS